MVELDEVVVPLSQTCTFFIAYRSQLSIVQLTVGTTVVYIVLGRSFRNFRNSPQWVVTTALSTCNG